MFFCNALRINKYARSCAEQKEQKITKLRQFIPHRFGRHIKQYATLEMSLDYE